MVTAMNGGRRITTHEAQLKTATVEVKALTISGKQVTLSVFRQLKDEDLIDSQTAALRGEPWGTVNYFWGQCAPNHLHVVWQKGDELRRGCCWRQASDQEGFLSAKRSRLRALAAYYLTWRVVRGDEGYRNDHGWGKGRINDELRNLSVGGHDVYACVDDWVDELYGFRWPYGDRERDALEDYQRQEIERAQGRRHRLAEQQQAFVDGMREKCWQSPEAVLEGMHCDVAAMAAFRGAWAEQYDALAALDQLFIAV